MFGEPVSCFRSLGRIPSFLLTASMLILAPAHTHAAVPCSGTLSGSGQATYYSYTPGNGNCSFIGDDSDAMVAAINIVDYDNSAMCGRYLRITGPNGSVDVRIVDSCPSCSQGDVDLNEPAFSQIADLSAGVVAISWTTIPDPTTGKVQYYISSGSNPYYMQLQPRHTRYGISSLEYLSPSGYVTAPRTSYNDFIIDSNLGVPVPLENPFTVRITDVHGQVLVQSGIPFSPGNTFDGDSQFPLCGTSTSSPPASAKLVTLDPPHPNPFNPSTTLSFHLARAGQVKLQIFDADGRTVTTLVDEFMDSGRHELRWAGRDQNGRPVVSGVYFAQLRMADRSQTQRLVLVQ